MKLNLESFCCTYSVRSIAICTLHVLKKGGNRAYDKICSNVKWSVVIQRKLEIPSTTIDFSIENCVLIKHAGNSHHRIRAIKDCCTYLVSKNKHSSVNNFMA